MNVGDSCHLPYLALGYSWDSISGSCPWKEGGQEEGQAARPGPAAPIQGVGTILAPGPVMPAKLGRWEFQGWGLGLRADKGFAVNTAGKGDCTAASTTRGGNCGPATWSSGQGASIPPSFPAGDSGQL